MLKAIVAFCVLPGVFGILVPISIGVADPLRGAGSYLGSIAVCIGMGTLGWCIRDFYASGKGTLAPWAPPEHLVIVGLYRHVRNPMYLAVVLVVAGFAGAFASPLVALYCILLAVGFHLRVAFHEEPWLAKRFGEDWAQYKKNVSRWFPGVTPFRSGRL